MKNRDIGFLALLLLVTGCALSDSPVKARMLRARRGKGDVVIGAGGDWRKTPGARNGIEMAARELNAAGGVLGRKVRIIFADDKGELSTATQVAQSFADNRDMVAVIGHLTSDISVPVSIQYEYHGLLMISPLSTSPRLTSQGFRRVFRNAPNDSVTGHRLAAFCAQRGYRRLLIYHLEDDYGIGLANVFERAAETFGMDIPDREQYDFSDGPSQFREDLTHWREKYEFDAIFLAGRMPRAATFIREARRLGIMAPIIGGDGLDSPDLSALAKDGIEQIYVATFFNPEDPRPEVQAFVGAYKAAYEDVPCAAAAQSYDAVRGLADAMTRAGTTVPDEVAEALRNTRDWHGVNSVYSFDDKGDIEVPGITIKAVRNGAFAWSKHLQTPAEPDGDAGLGDAPARE